MVYEYKDNIFFDDDMPINNDNIQFLCDNEDVVSLKGYTLIENPLWCDNTLSKNRNLFLEEDSTFNGKVSVQKKGGVYSQ